MLSHLTPFARNEIDGLRTEIWLAVAIARSGVTGPDGLERSVRRSLRMEGEKSGNFQRFHKGNSRPFKHAAGPTLRALAWPQRVDKLWPGTLAWLVTPFWFLLHASASFEELRRCVLQLPPRYQEDLLVWLPGESHAPLELALIHPMLICDLSTTVGPQALGALSCAGQRARFSGDARSERLAISAMAWMLFEMCSRVPQSARPVFTRLLDCFLWWSAEHIYSPGLLLPVTSRELESFDELRSRHLALDPIETPDYIEALFRGSITR